MGHSVVLVSNSTVTVAYLSKQDGTISLSLCPVDFTWMEFHSMDLGHHDRPAWLSGSGDKDRVVLLFCVCSF